MALLRQLSILLPLSDIIFIFHPDPGQKNGEFYIVKDAGTPTGKNVMRTQARQERLTVVGFHSFKKMESDLLGSR